MPKSDEKLKLRNILSDFLLDVRYADRGKGIEKVLEEQVNDLISIIKSNIGSVAMVCPECDKGLTSWKDGKSVFKDGKHVLHRCKKCHGTGVVSKD
jgi:hypothetical protein